MWICKHLFPNLLWMRADLKAGKGQRKKGINSTMKSYYCTVIGRKNDVLNRFKNRPLTFLFSINYVHMGFLYKRSRKKKNTVRGRIGQNLIYLSRDPHQPTHIYQSSMTQHSSRWPPHTSPRGILSQTVNEYMQNALLGRARKISTQMSTHQSA